MLTQIKSKNASTKDDLPLGSGGSVGRAVASDTRDPWLYSTS